jgi:hypothetical protein
MGKLHWMMYFSYALDCSAVTNNSKNIKCINIVEINIYFNLLFNLVWEIDIHFIYPYINLDKNTCRIMHTIEEPCIKLYSVILYWQCDLITAGWCFKLTKFNIILESIRKSVKFTSCGVWNTFLSKCRIFNL